MKSHNMYNIWQFPAILLVEMGGHMTFEVWEHEDDMGRHTGMTLGAKWE